MADNHFSDLADPDADRMHLGALLCGTNDLLYDRADEECIPADGLGHNMQGKLSMYDFYLSLVCLVDNTGAEYVKVGVLIVIFTIVAKHKLVPV